MTPEHKQAFDSLFDYIYKKDAAAISISHSLLELCHAWDDIVDGDPITQDQVNSAFSLALFDLPKHPYWFQFGLNVHFLNVYLRWRDANIIEADPSSTDNDLSKTYMLRAGIYDLFVIIAYHLYGDEWAKTIGVTVRKFYGETLAEYVEEMRCQTR